MRMSQLITTIIKTACCREIVSCRKVNDKKIATGTSKVKIGSTTDIFPLLSDSKLSKDMIKKIAATADKITIF